ncbi:MAG: hypothetical protein ACSLE9_06690 [Burkholderiaceae bacterium]
MTVSKLALALRTSTVDCPEGLDPGLYQVTMTRPDGTPTILQSADKNAFTFEASIPGNSMEPGTYTFVAAMLATTGEFLSDPVSGSFTIAPDVVIRKIDVPVGIDISAS